MVQNVVAENHINCATDFEPCCVILLEKATLKGVLTETRNV